MKGWVMKVVPTVLTGLGIIGVGATAVSAVKCKPEADERVRNAAWELKKEATELTKFEKFKAAAPAYIPAVLIGTATGACIFGSHFLSRKTQASLTAACVAGSEYHKKFRKKLVELRGEETAKEVETEMACECASFHRIGLDAPDRKMWFTEPITGQKMHRYEREVMHAELHLNRMYIMCGGLSLNTYLEFLGLDKVAEGDDTGWSFEQGIEWLDFEHIPTGEDTCTLQPIFWPDKSFMDDIC